MSGRNLCERLGVAHNWLSKRNTGQQPFALDDLFAIAKELGTTVGELLGVESRPLAHRSSQHLDDFLEDGQVPRSVKEEVEGALGNILRLAYQMAEGPRSIKRAPRRGRRA